MSRPFARPSGSSRAASSIESAAIAYSRRRADRAAAARTEAFLAGRPFSEETFREAGPARVPRSSRSPTSAVRATFACSSPRTSCSSSITKRPEPSLASDGQAAAPVPADRASRGCRPTQPDDGRRVDSP